MLRSVSLLDELEAALASGPNRRGRQMLTRITDLFVGSAPHYSEDQIRLFDDVMVRLVATIEAKARARLAHRLAAIANAPREVINLLAFDDDIDVARPVLLKSARLGEAALLANAGSKGQRHLLAIAQRKSLGEAVTDVLIERGDPDVVHALVKNSGARLSGVGFRMLIKRSSGDDALATLVGRRSDISRQHFVMLLRRASSAVRARLTAGHRQAGSSVEAMVAHFASALRSVTPNAAADLAAAKAAVERQISARRVGEAEIHQYARDRRFEETAMALSVLCDTPIEVVERALLDPGAEMLLILAKVAALSATTTKALLLLQAADRGMSAKDLDRALRSFNRLQPEAARRVLGFFRTRLATPAAPMVPPAVAVNA
ncbi:MAG TPA: DUF2336 domain-containing protein [Xanthobacteraceae bacterium]|jgi:uncharacterized protein (DUF2336 family)